MDDLLLAALRLEHHIHIVGVQPGGDGGVGSEALLPGQLPQEGVEGGVVVVPPEDGAEPPPVTRTMQMARLDPSVTTTWVVPEATGVTVPSLETVAMEGFSLIQV